MSALAMARASAAVKERPVPYSAPMVRARRAGLKTNTRRLINPQPFNGASDESIIEQIGGRRRWQTLSQMVTDAWQMGFVDIPCPYGQLGDRLWPREAWRTTAPLDHLPPRDIPRDAPIWYEADGPAPAPQFGRYRHARFMCRWMSRGLDEVTGVRAERLQDISEEDAISEGIYPYQGGWSNGLLGPFSHPILAFADLIDSVNGPGTWDRNYWVWVVEFRRVVG